MKKYHLYLWIIALMGLMTACSQDEAAGPQNEASNRVRIGTSMDEALQTRAASVTIPANHKLRYVLEVWSTAGTPACIHHDEKTATGAEAVAFDFTLSEAGDYKALLWADFVSESASTTQVTSPNTYTHYADLHYKTNSDNGLKAVTLAKTGTAYVINDDARDAFFACITIKKETGAFEESVELKRPFGQINVIEKNTELLAKVASMTLSYNVLEQFNVETGSPQGTAAVNPTVTTLPTADRKANLFYDFIFTPTTAQTLVGSIKLTFTSTDSRITLPDYTIPANMPAVRNKRTNISGSILQANSNHATLTVTVSDAWTKPDEERDIDELVWNGTSTSQPAGYTASTPGEVNINTAAELAWLAQLPQQYTDLTGYTFKLTADIDLNNHEWTPIGQRLYGFKGTFDGQGHTVRKLKCTSQNSAGLFSRITTATVKNVTVSGTISYNTNNASLPCYLGGIAGEVNNSTITDCTNQCTISATGTNQCFVGGIAGFAVNEDAYDNSMTFSGNTNTGNLSTSEHATSRVGGIIGVAWTTLENRSITLTQNSYDAGTPANICIGRCIFNSGGNITIDGASATHDKPYPYTEP